MNLVNHCLGIKREEIVFHKIYVEASCVHHLPRMKQLALSAEFLMQLPHYNMSRVMTCGDVEGEERLLLKKKNNLDTKRQYFSVFPGHA